LSEGFYVGDYLVHYYGILIMLGAVLGAVLAASEAKRRGHDPEIVWDLLIWLVIAGVIGARLWHIFTPPPSSIASGLTTKYYLSHPLAVLAIWNGGLGIPGAVIGGAIALFFYSRKNGLNFVEWADIAAPSLALGQAVGRWGNYFNQELYGARTDLPWAIYIQHEGDTFHPLFLYESLWNLFNMALLIWLSRRFSSQLKSGDILLVYLIVYPVGRFFLDFLRLDAAMVGGINVNQVFMAVVAICALVALLWRHQLRSI